MRIEIGWLPRLLTRSPVHSIALSDGTLIVAQGKTPVQIPLQAITHVIPSPGLIWSSVTIQQASGSPPLRIAGLKRREARALNALVVVYRCAPQVRAATQAFKALCDQGGYLSHRRYQQWRRQYELCTDGVTLPLDDLDLPADLTRDVTQFLVLLQDVPALVAKRNDLYVERLLTKHRNWFDTLERFPLTPKQREAIVHDEDNCLVVAGAGTGKTSTVMGKVGFVLELNAATAEEILLLAFTQKAKTEMEERIRSKFAAELEARTFHSLGLEIISQVEGKKPSLAKWATDPNALDALLQRFVNELLSDPKHGPLLLNYLAYYLAAYKPPEQFATLHEYAKYMNAQDIRTFKGERVKSYQEALIANWLFLHGIRYQYEAKYPHDTATIEHRQYAPDFFLPDHGVYIEHFGVDRQGRTAPWIDASAYTRAMEWKRALHRQHGTRLVETYSYEKREGTLFKHLEARLVVNGIMSKPIDPEEAKRAIQQSGCVSRLNKLLGTFLGHFKGNQHSLDELRVKASRCTDPDRALAFLQVFEVVLERYEAELRKAEDIDFHDMIARATGYVQSGRYVSRFRYVVVDEFQDISVGRYRLLKALLDQVPDPHLFCVGDDWQAIYRFAGSDISLMTSFQDHFGYTRTTALDRTFRFNDRLCEFGTRFILKNPHQIAKKLQTHEHVEEASVQVVMVPLGGSPEETLATTLMGIHRRAGWKEASVLLLGRFRHDCPKTLAQLRRQFSAMQIDFMTAHAAKGLEADYVVVLNVNSGRYGFPCEIEDDPLLSLVLAEGSAYPNAEERRLFYVAVTRARKRTYLITQEGQQSSFIDEIAQPEYQPLVVLDGQFSPAPMCPQCKGGRLLRRSGSFKEFWGCSNYPYCDAIFELCPKCNWGAFMRDRSGYRCSDAACGHTAMGCPQCGSGKLVVRTGRYGRFYGCSNFPKGCRYTQQVR